MSCPRYMEKCCEFMCGFSNYGVCTYPQEDLNDTQKKIRELKDILVYNKDMTVSINKGTIEIRCKPKDLDVGIENNEIVIKIKDTD